MLSFSSFRWLGLLLTTWVFPSTSIDGRRDSFRRFACDYLVHLPSAFVSTRSLTSAEIWTTCSIERTKAACHCSSSLSVAYTSLSAILTPFLSSLSLQQCPCIKIHKCTAILVVPFNLNLLLLYSRFQTLFSFPFFLDFIPGFLREFVLLFL